jgi:uncharacterized protein (TIGR00299 family) protein
MNILYYDCFAGISGDMNLAAMIDLGVDPGYLRAELSRLGLDREFELRVSADSRHGIRGARVDVALAERDGHHGHAAHRTLADITAIIQGGGLSPEVRRTSLAMFRRLAEAEAKVHGKAVDEVHFHEVGAVDAIVDIVGAAICFHRLGVDAVWSSPVELGGGFVRCAHGVVPVPAPATVEILQGLPTTRGAVRHETATPTGAAILAVLADDFPATPALAMQRTAYGIGHRDPADIPNVLRVHLARPASARRPEQAREARLLQCNIDDMTAEALGVAMDVLMENGAMDVHFTPILMKKNRPATSVSLLCAASDEKRFRELLFRHTTTLGVKSFPLEKTALDVAFERLDTPLGPVTMKNALRDGKVIRSKPELEDCRELAARHGLSLAEVYARIAGCRKEPGA